MANPLPNANELLSDAYIRHQIQLLRYSKGLSKELSNLLDQKDAELELLILQFDNETEMLQTKSGQNRLIKLQSEIRQLREEVWKPTNAELQKQLDDLSRVEVGFISEAAAFSAPTIISTVLPGAAVLNSITRSRPFEGRLLKEWADKMEADDIARISNQIKLGLVGGETNKELVRRIFGTAKLSNSDGIKNATKGQISTIVRTAVMHVSNNARYEMMLLNQDLFEYEEFIATLDSRTSKICASLDKKRFLVGTGPYPPLHMNCRSIRRAAFDQDVVGERPSKPITEKILLRQYGQENGLKLRSRDDLPHGQKGIYDKWARQKIRDSIGPVRGDESYQTWLKQQSDEFQDEWLGKTKGKLFRDGGMRLDQFVHQTGDEITLAQIAKNNAMAFERAGLNPKDYL